MDADGSGRTRLKRCGCGYPTWAPDGGAVAIVTEFDLLLVSLDGARSRRVANADYSAFDWQHAQIQLRRQERGRPQGEHGLDRTSFASGWSPATRVYLVAYGPDGKRRLVASGAPDDTGRFSVTVRPAATTEFRAELDAGATPRPFHDVEVGVRPIVRIALFGQRGRSGGAFLYRLGRGVGIAAVVVPNHYGKAKMVFLVQRRGPRGRSAVRRRAPSASTGTGRSPSCSCRAARVRIASERSFRATATTSARCRRGGCSAWAARGRRPQIADVASGAFLNPPSP
jgi:hypothetical protein